MCSGPRHGGPTTSAVSGGEREGGGGATAGWPLTQSGEPRAKADSCHGRGRRPAIISFTHMVYERAGTFSRWAFFCSATYMCLLSTYLAGSSLEKKMLYEWNYWLRGFLSQTKLSMHFQFTKLSFSVFLMQVEYVLLIIFSVFFYSWNWHKQRKNNNCPHLTGSRKQKWSCHTSTIADWLWLQARH